MLNIYKKNKLIIIICILTILLTGCDYFTMISPLEYIDKKYSFAESCFPSDKTLLIDTTPILSWPEIPYANSYDLNLVMTSGVNNPVIMNIKRIVDPSVEITTPLETGAFKWTVQANVEDSEESIKISNTFGIVKDGAWESFEDSEPGQFNNDRWQTSGNVVVRNGFSSDGFQSVLFSNLKAGTQELTTTIDLEQDSILSFVTCAKDYYDQLEVFIDGSTESIPTKSSHFRIHDPWSDNAIYISKGRHELTWRVYTSGSDSEQGPWLDAISITPLDDCSPVFASLNVPEICTVLDVQQTTPGPSIDQDKFHSPPSALFFGQINNEGYNSITVEIQTVTDGYLSFNAQILGFGTKINLYINGIKEISYSEEIKEWKEQRVFLEQGIYSIKWEIQCRSSGMARIGSFNFVPLSESSIE